MRWLILAAMFTAACVPTAPTDRDLEANARLWDRVGPASYSMVVRSVCFCAGPHEVRVEVVSGRIASRTAVDTGQPLDPAFETRFPDVPGLFELIRDAFRRNAAQVQVTYDPARGYPSSLSIDYIGNAIDDEIVTTVTSFQAKP